MTWIEFNKDRIINTDVLEMIYLTVYGEDHYDRGKWVIKAFVANAESPFNMTFDSKEDAEKKYREICNILIKK